MYSMLKLTCSNCKYTWEYEGKMKYYATCPDCHINIPIRELTKAHFDKVYENE